MPLANANKGAYSFGEFQLDQDMGVLMRDGRRVALGRKAFEILTCLVDHAGEVVTKADLLRSVWADAYVEEGTLAQHIFSLRKALGDKADFVATVPGQGYRFMGAVRHNLPNSYPRYPGHEMVHEVNERTHIVIEEPMPAAVAPLAMPRRRWRYAAASVALIAVGVGAVGYWSFRARPSQYLGTVVADFTDTTGDAAFGRALKRAMEIELSQSQFMGVLSDQDTVGTLHLMGMKPDTPLTPAIARDICERTNQQVLLTGSITGVGTEYLLTIDATDCTSGKRVVSVKTEAPDKTKLLSAVDTLAGEMRSKLGESAKAIRHNDVPLAQAATSSLEALRVYSTAQYMADTQNAPVVTLVPLYQRAVELDPQFALAYEAMAGNYYELQEGRLASENYKKAFDLRDRVGESDRLGFEARYYAYGLGDAVAGLNAFRTWAAMYPHDYRPWVNISNFDNQLGNFGEAIAAGEHAIQVNPNYSRAYAVTARAYKNASRFAEAKAVEGESQRRWPGASNTTFEIAFYEHDQATFDRHIRVFEEQKWQLRHYYLGQARSMEGKYAEAKRLLELEIDEDRQQGKAEIVDGVLVELAKIARLYGYPAEARAYLARISKGYLDSDDAAFEFALNGDVSYAKRFLAAHEHDQHAPTDQAAIAMPQLRAAVALQIGRPAEALAALEPSRPYILAGFDTRAERAMAYMKMGEPAKAAEDYNSIVQGPGSGFGVLYPMAQLGLARAYAAAGDTAASRTAYQSFLSAWKEADPGLPVLKAAKAELAGLH
jgi:DNA-binding winged helix-turn-helix (wHTH) protein/Tfp pilus assembly protein PilF